MEEKLQLALVIYNFLQHIPPAQLSIMASSLLLITRCKFYPNTDWSDRCNLVLELVVIAISSSDAYIKIIFYMETLKNRHTSYCNNSYAKSNR